MVGLSASNDLAVIKVAASSDLVPATFGESLDLKVGQAVVAAGAPLGLTESVTSGIVSNTARPVRSGTDGDAVYLAVQTDAAINPGNSGGPLVDLNGSVIGINSSIATTGASNGSQSGNIGIGFAIPSDLAIRVATEIIADGSSADSALGVNVGGNDSSTASTGVALQDVTPGGAADRAGLQAGDVVTKLNDFETTSPDAPDRRGPLLRPRHRGDRHVHPRRWRPTDGHRHPRVALGAPDKARLANRVSCA